MIRTLRYALRTSAALATIGLVACGSSSTAPAGKTAVTLSFAGVRPAALTAAALDAQVMTNMAGIVVGSDALIITEAKLVLRKIELKRSNVTCTEGTPSDDCEEFKLGPTLVTLPLAVGAQTSVSVSVPAGTYRELEFQIHRPVNDALDVAFKTANPEFANISIRVRGTFNGVAFEYTSQLSEEQEIQLLTPLVVVDGQPTNLTLRFDMDTWFRVGRTTGALVNPNTANAGGANESLVKDNIKASIKGFEDKNHNGDDRDG